MGEPRVMLPDFVLRELTSYALAAADAARTHGDHPRRLDVMAAAAKAREAVEDAIRRAIRIAIEPGVVLPVLDAEQFERLFEIWRQLLEERRQLEDSADRDAIHDDPYGKRRICSERDIVVETLMLAAGVPRPALAAINRDQEALERQLDAVRAIGNENGLAAQQLRDRAAELERILDPIREQASGAGRHSSEIDIVAWLVEQVQASAGRQSEGDGECFTGDDDAEICPSCGALPMTRHSAHCFYLHVQVRTQGDLRQARELYDRTRVECDRLAARLQELEGVPREATDVPHAG